MEPAITRQMLFSLPTDVMVDSCLETCGRHEIKLEMDCVWVESHQAGGYNHSNKSAHLFFVHITIIKQKNKWLDSVCVSHLSQNEPVHIKPPHRQLFIQNTGQIHHHIPACSFNHPHWQNEPPGVCDDSLLTLSSSIKANFHLQKLQMNITHSLTPRFGRNSFLPQVWSWQHR